VRPLASAREEFRLVGSVALGLSLVLGAVLAATRAHPGRFAVAFGAVALFFGGVMYAAFLRRYVRTALEQAESVSSPQLETQGQTARRVTARSLAVNAPFVAFVLLMFGPRSSGGAILGIAAGNGIGFLALARRVRRWEARNAVYVLREPRWRGAPYKGRLGRGIIDPQDFYFVCRDAGPPEGRSSRSWARSPG
jgi:hypothetical protein